MNVVKSGEAETNLSSLSFLHPQNWRNYMKALELFSDDAHQVLGLGRGSSLRCTHHVPPQVMGVLAPPRLRLQSGLWPMMPYEKCVDAS
jgi:hypothetical protein